MAELQVVGIRVDPVRSDHGHVATHGVGFAGFDDHLGTAQASGCTIAKLCAGWTNHLLFVDRAFRLVDGAAADDIARPRRLVVARLAHHDAGADETILAAILTVD